MIRRYAVAIAVSLLTALGPGQHTSISARQDSDTDQSAAASSTSGGTTTVLPDGRWLLIGGSDGAVTASIWDPQVRTTTPTAGPLQVPRTGHSATVLPDGTVLILGGQDANVLVETPEIFDPGTGRFTPVSIVGATPRRLHTATLLTDERVLVAGGTNGGPIPLPTEIWDLNTRSATTTGSTGIDRSGHTATLMADGRVLVAGGNASDGTPVTDPVAVDPLGGSVRPVTQSRDRTVPAVTASIPPSGATDVLLDAHMTLRFSDALNVSSLSSETVTLNGPSGPVPARVIAAEEGRLAFVWPADRLVEDATYVLSVSGAVDRFGVAVVPSSITFKTMQRPEEIRDGADPEEWIPDAATVKNGWRANRPRSPWESLPPLAAPPGVTAISGRVLTLDGRPLAGVTLAMDGARETQSDRTGRFLLLAPSISAARHVLEIEGETASRPGRQYGFFEYGMTVVTGQTSVLPFTIWMPKLDTAHAVQMPSPTTSEVVVTTPRIPGLELHIPPRTVIRDEDGQPVTQLAITAIPVDRPPFPLATNVDVPVYFTIQPGGSYIYTYGSGPKGGWLVYPNYREGVPGQQVQFFHYDPEEKDWYVYGLGTVTKDAAQVAPDATTRFYELTGAMINGSDSPPPGGTTPFSAPKADPMDPSTGVFSMHKTDLFLPDVIPIALTRTFNSGDNLDRPFGFGMTHLYAMFLWSANQYQEADLILPEGGRIHYVRTSPGTGYLDAVFEHTATPTAFYKSTIVHRVGVTDGWDLRLTDGTVYHMGENAPIQSIRDRYGNLLTISHANGQTGNVTRVTSPNGRWIEFTYDTHTPKNHVTQVTDNIGRTVSYTYDANGNLSTVTDPEGKVTTYTYDSSHRLLTITDGRNITYLTNTYANGRLATQTLADTSATYGFSYTVDGSGNITQTDITDPRGHVERLVFNGDHYVTSDTQAYGASLARTTTTTRQTGSNLVTAVVDGLNRRTEYTYDSTGHVLTMTRLAGTAEAVTTTFTYEPTFFQLATVTDPVSHVWTIGYDSSGRPTSVTDPLSHQTGVGMNLAGQLTSLTDPLSHTWQFGYFGGDLTSVTDPLNAVRSQFVDAGGRVVSATDPLGRVTRTAFDKVNRVTSVTDPLGGQTTFTYDANSNLLSLTDALTHATSYTYDSSDRVATRTDPLTHADNYQYDANNNLTQTTDRKSQVTGSQYDALDRLTQVTFHDSSTIAYTYDAGDRITQIVDSANGTMTRTYDGLDRLTQETTPQGTVNYTYDADGRRATMTVAGQSAVSYGYDNAHRLTSVTQGSASVAFTYDNANRRSTLTFPNGIVATYAYDNANQLTSLTYTLGQTTLGTLTYTYDAAGDRTSVGGTWARTGLPAALTSATYDAANRITAWGGTSFSYDANGNLSSDGTTTYTWNARDQLTAMSGGVSASFAYDGLARRRSKTVSGTTTNFLYDGLNLVQELTSGGTPTANLLTGLGIDETFTRTISGGTETLLTDALGSTLALADGLGAVQTTYTYAPFGATSVAGTTSTNAQQFTGRENDGTGLYYYRARYYSPLLLRFTSEDPLEFLAGDPNLHAYVWNAPTNWTDPLGLIALSCSSRKTFGWNSCNPLLASLSVGGLGVGPAIGAAAAAGIGFGAGAGAGSGSAAAAAAAAARSGARRAFERQLARDGVKSLEKSLRSLERRLRQHVDKFDAVSRDGGYTSSIEREIRNFQRLIEILKDMIGLK